MLSYVWARTCESISHVGGRCICGRCRFSRAPPRLAQVWHGLRSLQPLVKHEIVLSRCAPFSGCCNKEMLDAVKRFLRLAPVAGVPPKPKAHVCGHVPRRSLTEGSPADHATWMDETLNRHLASMGAAAHRKVWELRVLSSFELWMTSRKRLRDEA